jgi:hypothetical protein
MVELLGTVAGVSPQMPEILLLVSFTHRGFKEKLIKKIEQTFENKKKL